MKFSSTVTAALALGAAQAFPNPKSKSAERTVAVHRSTSDIVARQLTPSFQLRTRAVENVLLKRVKGGGDHVDEHGRVVKEPADFSGPHKPDEVKKLADKLRTAPDKAIKEALGEVNKRPRGKDANGKTIKWQMEIEGNQFKPGESGLLIKEDPNNKDNPAGYVVFLGYGDGMAFHADHEAALADRYSGIIGHGYQLRKEPYPREQTLKGVSAGDAPLHHDENPIRQLDAPEGMHSVMDVPPGESSMQGTMMQAAKKFVAEHGGVIRPFDNRNDPKIKEIRGVILRGEAGDNNGRGEPQVMSVDYKEEDVLSRMLPISRDIMPKALRDKIDAFEKANKGKGKKGKRSITKRAYDNDKVVTFSPFYNDMMTGADRFDLDSWKPFTNLDTFFSSLYPDLTVPNSNSKRDVIGDISSQEQNATDSSQDDDKQFIEELILAKEIAQNNLTVTIMPYIDAVMNGSSHPMAESIAWNIYSIVLPSVSVISPFEGPLDALDAIFTNGTETDKEWASAVSQFNNFVWGRAFTACNATGMLGPLYQLNAELSSYDKSLWPEDQWTVDEHTQEPFIDYLQQWFAYNEMPFTPGNGTDHVITPDWVLQELNLNNLNDTKTLNGTTISINGTVIDLTQNSTVTLPSNTTVQRRWSA